MSADNGIYILNCRDGFRVGHLQAIDNIYWNCRRKEDPEFNARELFMYFQYSKVYTERLEAMKEAIDTYEEIMNSDFPIVEYGIREIGSGNFEFPKECPPCCDNVNEVCQDDMIHCSNCGEYL